MKRATVLVGLLALVPATPAALAPAAATTASTSAHHRAQTAAKAERAIVACANRQRKRFGVAPLRRSAILEKAAWMHARNMLRQGFFDHVDPSGRGPAERVRLYERGERFVAVGENIAAGYRSVSAACRGWMRSPGHRANILDRDYRLAGGGFARGQRGYGTYFVQVFGRRANAR